MRISSIMLVVVGIWTKILVLLLIKIVTFALINIWTYFLGTLRVNIIIVVYIKVLILLKKILCITTIVVIFDKVWLNCREQCLKLILLLLLYKHWVFLSLFKTFFAGFYSFLRFIKDIGFVYNDSSLRLFQIKWSILYKKCKKS